MVWGKRVDPVRIRVMNVPLPESDRLFGDIILNDGAQEGTRTSGGNEFPVFNELAVWKRSEFSTFRVEVRGITPESKSSFERLCNDAGISFEDWGTIRSLCAACSRGNPGSHECVAETEENHSTRFGIAARGIDVLTALLGEWCELEPGLSVNSPELLICGVTQ